MTKGFFYKKNRDKDKICMTIRMTGSKNKRFNIFN